MGKCKYCGGSTGFFNNKEICKTCKNKFLLNAQLSSDNINRLTNDINKGFKEIDSYLSRLKIILEQYRTLNNAQEALPDLIKTNLNYQEMKANTEKFLLEFNENKISLIMAMKTEKGKARNIYKYLDSIDEAIQEYGEFKDILMKIKCHLTNIIQQYNFVRPNDQNKLKINLDSNRKLDDIEERFIEELSSQIKKHIKKNVELTIEVRRKYLLNFKLNGYQIGRIELISSHPQMQIIKKDTVEWINDITLQSAIDLIPEWIAYAKKIV
ncbi:hypothetical protein [Beduini massiliensis]|uniref:hypothetical protein n=1 Tax=Beduini massiliensis TaxID=1585974 RepID=UPI00059AA620|nr:hypothetical protein [Beduini massiliensis]